MDVQEMIERMLDDGHIDEEEAAILPEYGAAEVEREYAKRYPVTYDVSPAGVNPEDGDEYRVLVGGRTVASALVLPNGYITGVNTIPTERRKGYARLLMQRIIERGGYKRLSLVVVSSNTIARHLYESLGFMVEHEDHSEAFGGALMYRDCPANGPADGYWAANEFTPSGVVRVMPNATHKFFEVFYVI